MILKKRTCSFKPTPDVKVLLAEIETLLTALGSPLSLEEIINHALKKELPSLLLSLRGALRRQKEALAIQFLNEVDQLLLSNKINSLPQTDEFSRLSSPELDETHPELNETPELTEEPEIINECEEQDTEQELNRVNSDILKRFF